jgi:hypothetical protein
MSLPPANWYPAPDDPSRERWWNGAEWSDTFRAAGQPTPPPVPTYGQPLPYTTGYPQQQYGTAVAKNGLATAGLIVSIVSLLIGIYGLVCITGIALSGVGLSRARQMEAAGGVAVGKSAATAGLVIGIVSLVLNIVWIAWVASNPYFFRF